MKQTEIPAELRDALVVAVDDSPPAREALRWAAGLASAMGLPLHVLSVWNFVTGHPPQDQGEGTPSEAAWQREAERRLAALVAEELPDGSGDVRQVALHSNPVPGLLQVSEVAAQLVVGSRGRGGFTGLLLGSTSDQLVRHAACPVTVVRHGCTAS
jgi:nucleotide-binding universal stress UspA family protein